MLSLSCGVMILVTGGCTAGKEDKFILEAHRGWSEYYPENTLVAFEAAGNCEQFDAIETDVQETKDGILVLFHDKKIERMTSGEGKISDYTYEELQQLKIDGGNNVEEYPDEKIPTLKEYLEICKEYNKTPYIELKSLSDEGVVQLLELLKEEGLEGKCTFTSFRLEMVKKVIEATDAYLVEYMVRTDTDLEEELDVIAEYENVAFRPNAYEVTEEIIDRCREEGRKVECWGLESGDTGRYQWLVEHGVSGMTCNDWKNLNEE